jgi:integrase
MKKRFRLIRRNIRGGRFYLVDTLTGKRESLKSDNASDAERILNARNEAQHQPALNLHIAKAYLAGTDSGITTRTWQNALNAIIDTKHGSTKERWQRAAKEKPLALIRHRIIVETQADHLLAVLKAGTVSTNVHLRKLHNFCLDMNWLPWPILPKKQWPAVRYREKRAIALAEHQKVVAREENPERRAFYELCWHLGGSQGDVARLHAEDVDWQDRTLAYRRKKSTTLAIVHFSDSVAEILQRLPKAGPLFPNFGKLSAGHRATEFERACTRVGVTGVMLHSYRYAWAERAKTAGYPERFAMENLGHNSKAVHRAYAKKAQMKLPSLEDYENKLVTVEFRKTAG